MTARPGLRLRFAGILIGAVAALGSLAGPARADFSVTPTIVGAGKVQDGTFYNCANSPQSNTAEKTCPVSGGHTPGCGPFICVLQPPSLNLTATADDGWRFVGWSGAAPCGAAALCSMSGGFLIDIAYTPIAVFHEIVDATLTRKPANVSNSKTATFDYSSFVGTSVQCRLDGTTTRCSFGAGHTGSVTFTNLSEGSHTFQVSASSPNGNPNEPPLIDSWTVDTVAPTTTLDATSGPGQGALQTIDTETFKFINSEPSGGRTQCALDGENFSDCASPFTLAGLAPGAHSFHVRSVDRAGNTGSAVQRDWTVATPDSDGDGFNARIDCDDTRAAVHPGATEVPDNGIDENCDGADAHTPAAAVPAAAPAPAAAPVQQIIVTLGFSFRSKTKSTTFTNLAVKAVPLGATVTATCPKGCAKKSFTKRNAFGTISLKTLAKHALKAGTVITVKVDKPGSIAAVKVLKVRSGKAPLITTRCVPPGASEPVAC